MQCTGQWLRGLLAVWRGRASGGVCYLAGSVRLLEGLSQEWDVRLLSWSLEVRGLPSSLHVRTEEMLQAGWKTI
jgi:hypothetical protein